MIIYPPLIGSTIPGFINGSIKIPFKHNEAVPRAAVKGFACLIKNYNNSTQVGEILKVVEKTKIDAAFQTGEIEFTMSTDLTSSMYYKFQIAYMDDSSSTKNLKYSSVAIGKCIGDIPINIEFKSNTEIWNKENNSNNMGRTVEVLYKAPAAAEPIYSYQFQLYDSKLHLLEDTEELLYNNDNSEMQQGQLVSKIIYNRKYYKNTVDSDEIYTLRFMCTTVNGYTQTEIYHAKEADLLDSGVSDKYDLMLSVNQDNGYVNIQLTGADEADATRGFVIERSSNQIYWDVIKELHICEGALLSNCKYQDNSIEHGVKYMYQLREFAPIENNVGTLYSKAFAQKEITPYFEDTFLSDDKRQLKVRFNPKVSSFKDTILEQKQDTIGGQYPFFFRNGQVKYKEIPISGLISYIMDDEAMFISLDELGLDQEMKSTNLTGDNIAAERKFKLEVLDWLTNGRPKLFRSPTEGNYVVRLMNISLSPNDQLGRMLHTFSATGYETQNFKDYEKMQENKVVDGTTNVILPPATNKLRTILNGNYDTVLGSNIVSDLVIEAEENSKITQVVWENINTSYTPSIIVDGKVYYNSGIVLNLEGAYDQIIIKKEPGVEYTTLHYLEVSNFDINNEFNKALEYNQLIIEIECGDEVLEVPMDKIYHVYQIAVTGLAGGGKFNDSEIPENQTKFYSGVSSIKGQKVNMVIYYLGEEMNNEEPFI